MEENILFEQEEKMYLKNQLMVNSRGCILQKADHKKGKRHDYYI